MVPRRGISLATRMMISARLRSTPSGMELVVAHLRHPLRWGQDRTPGRSRGRVAVVPGQQTPRSDGVADLDLLAQDGADQGVPRAVGAGQEERAATPQVTEAAPRRLETGQVVVVAE